MKKTSYIILSVLTLVIIAFSGCTGNGQNNATNSPSITASAGNKTAEAANTPEKTTAVPNTETPDSGPKADTGIYTIELDMAVLKGNVGFIFNGYGDTFLMWQLNTSNSADGELYFRPHTWEYGTPLCIDEILVDKEVATGAVGENIHMKIEMNKGTVTTYLNGTLVYTFEVEEYDYLDNCEMGFRTDSYGLEPSDLESGSFDNMTITNSLGEVIFSEDFEGETNYFSDMIEDGGYDCVVEDGKLIVGRESKVQFSVEMPPLN